VPGRGFCAIAESEFQRIVEIKLGLVKGRDRASGGHDDVVANSQLTRIPGVADCLQSTNRRSLLCLFGAKGTAAGFFQILDSWIAPAWLSCAEGCARPSAGGLRPPAQKKQKKQCRI
jgi:hypothetical protein